MSTDDTLTVKQLAKKLKVHPNTVYTHAARGTIPVMRLGGALRFNLSQVLAALAESSDPWALPKSRR